MANQPRPNPTDPDDSQINWELMARYVVGECTPEEAAKVQAQLQQHSEDARVIAAIGERAARLRTPISTDIDVEGALAKVHARMATADETRVLPFRRNRWTTASIGILAAAAAVIAVMVILPRVNRPAE